MPAVPTLAAFARLAPLLLICLRNPCMLCSSLTDAGEWDTRAKIKDVERFEIQERFTADQPLPIDPAEDEEERAFIREMMEESHRTTAKEIERLYGPLEMSE